MVASDKTSRSPTTSLRGTRPLAKYPLAELRPQRVEGHEINAATGPLFEGSLKSGQGEEPDGPITGAFVRFPNEPACAGVDLVKPISRLG